MKRGAGNPEKLLHHSAEREAAKPHEIYVDHDLTRQVDEAIDILKEDENLFHRGGSLVRTKVTGSAKKQRGPLKREPGSLVIEPYPAASMREHLLLKTHFFTVERDDHGTPKRVPCSMPSDIISTMRARAAWPGVRRLDGIVHAPTMRADGSLVQVPGYDDESELVFDPGGETFPLVPLNPSKADAHSALEKILDVVVDVPFASDAHRSAWVACVLTTIGRSWINGCAPLFAIDANIRGAGKSLLADVTSIIATGRSAARMAQPESDAEARKCITSLLIEGTRLVLIDNVSRPLGSASLDALLTSEIWRDRVLGASKSVTVPNDATWLATGNNLSFCGDTVRRTLHVRLDSPDENPEDRSDFRYPDLRGHVREHRGELAAAALTILRAYAAADMPLSKSIKLWGSFEGWSKTIAGACVWVGLPDPQSTRVELEADADPAKAALSSIMTLWPQLFPLGSTVKNAVSLLYPRLERGEERGPDGWDPLRMALETLAPPVPGRAPDAAKLGYALRAYKKRVIGGSMLDSTTDRNGVAVWVVRGMRGTAGDILSNETPPSETRLARTKHAPQSPSSPAVVHGDARRA